MNHPDPVVSVVVPNYKHEQWIIECLDSIRAQTLDEIELIIVDDASPDSSADRIRQWVDEHWPTAKVILNETNKGLVPILNTALQSATGTYVQTIASDDFLHPDKLSLQVRAMEDQPNAALCYSDMTLVDADSRVTHASAIDFWEAGSRHGKIPVARRSGMVLKLVLAADVPFCTPTWLIRRTMLIEAGGFDSAFTQEDTPLLIRLSSKHPLLFVDAKLVNYRIHATNTSLSGGIASTAQSRRAWFTLLMELCSHEEAWQEGLALYTRRTRALYLGNRRCDALPHLRLCAHQRRDLTSWVLYIGAIAGVDGRWLRRPLQALRRRRAKTPS